MLEEHDQDMLVRCRRLGHEIHFGYCRREAAGKPCRMIFDCWWESFDVRGFLRAHLFQEMLSNVEEAASLPACPKLVSLLELIERAKARRASDKRD